MSRRDITRIAQRFSVGIGVNTEPMSPEVAKAVGYRQRGDWRFLNLLRAANLCGLVNGSGASATISLEKLGRDLVAPSSPDDRKKALLDAFRKVEDFGRSRITTREKESLTTSTS